MSTGIAKMQAKYVLWGFIIFTIFATTTDVLLPSIDKSTSTGNYGILGLIFIVVAVAYSILAHHLFDIRVIIKKTLVYSSLLLFVLVTYTLVVVSTMALLGANVNLGWNTIIPNMFAALLIAVGFKPLEEWLSEATDRWLFKGEYNQQEVLSNLSDKLAGVIDLDEALGLMMKSVTEAMRIDKAVTFVLRPSPKEEEMDKKVVDRGIIEVKRIKSLGYAMEDRRMRELIYPVIKYFEKHPDKDTIITDNLERIDAENPENAKVIASLREMKGAIAMPVKITKNEKLKTKNADAQNTKDDSRLIGIFILGDKLSGDMFSEKDLNLLDIAVNQTAAAVEKARFYEEDQLKSEFVSIASHELLTPTSAIEGYLSMILDEKLAKVDKKAEGYLQKVYGSSRRLAALVKDLLNVSRIEGGRVVIQWQAFDLISTINSVIDELSPKAKEKKLRLVFANSNDKIQILNETQNSKQKSIENLKFKIKNSRQGRVMVFADQDRLHQVLVNIIGNAIKYSLKGNVLIRVNDAKEKAEREGEQINVSVTDTGIGMTSDDQKHLFEKFYRASNASKYGAQGTGLGLYITKSLIELMGGKIWFISKLEKGATFYFTINLATEEQIKDHSEKPQGPSFMPMKK